MLNQRDLSARVFQALGDPTRLAIVDRLSRGGATVSELAAPFDMTLAAVVQHVQALEEAGLIKTQKEGRARTCTLNPRTLRAVESWVSRRRELWERDFDRLAAIVDGPDA